MHGLRSLNWALQLGTPADDPGACSVVYHAHRTAYKLKNLSESSCGTPILRDTRHAAVSLVSARDQGHSHFEPVIVTASQRMR